MQMQPRAPQDPPLIADGTASSSTSTQTATARSRPPFFVSVTCPPSATASECSSGRSNSSAADFASQAVWGVVITTLIVAVLLVVILIYVKRRVRRRNRERIRALLWELVQGVQEGRVDESRLQQALYGVDPKFMNLATPVIYEVCVDTSTPADSKSKSIPLEVTSPTQWDNLTPLSISQPRGLPSNPSKGRTSVSRTRISLGKKPQDRSMERHLDVSVVVVMPHERKELASPPQSTSSLRTTTTESIPLTIATASPSFQEALDNPIVPIARPQRKVDPLSSVAAASQAQRGRRATNEANPSHPPNNVGRDAAMR